MARPASHRLRLGLGGRRRRAEGSAAVVAACPHGAGLRREVVRGTRSLGRSHPPFRFCDCARPALCRSTQCALGGLCPGGKVGRGGSDGAQGARDQSHLCERALQLGARLTCTWPEALKVIQQSTEPDDRAQGLALIYYALGRKADSDAQLATLTREHANDDAFEIVETHAYRGEI